MKKKETSERRGLCKIRKKEQRENNGKVDEKKNKRKKQANENIR